MNPLQRSSLALLLAVALGAGAAPSYAVADDPLPVDPFVPGIHEDPTLATAWQRWQSRAIDDYVITVRRSCYCPPESAVRTVVRDDAVRRVTRGEKRLGPALGYSMDGMYVRLREAMARADRVEVDWTERGVPRAITIDPDLSAADEETYFSVVVRRL
ncbi:hypothetical protein F4692_002221 [Nocardioides cavernae]|uniref:Uncharacterized protein n=1 Tax=Nocardioides cavernae TaxID=1921566 RepID=A0A7Y9H351_9ACTN|nr:DUF6174 domain-containing protein [Nocardioides cavernae]NYE37088.1 hypothetical protein [Nocardioides cavernae]